MLDSSLGKSTDGAILPRAEFFSPPSLLTHPVTMPPAPSDLGDFMALADPFGLSPVPLLLSTVEEPSPQVRDWVDARIDDAFCRLLLAGVFVALLYSYLSRPAREPVVAEVVCKTTV